MLSALTFGILEVLFVGPYRGIAGAGLYEQLKKEALENGVIRPDELGTGRDATS